METISLMSNIMEAIKYYGSYQSHVKYYGSYQSHVVSAIDHVSDNQSCIRQSTPIIDHASDI